jgi:hypothetical protein
MIALTVELWPTSIVPLRLNPSGPVIVYSTVSSAIPGATWRSNATWPVSGCADSIGSIAQPPIHAPVESPPSKIVLSNVILFMRVVLW